MQGKEKLVPCPFYDNIALLSNKKLKSDGNIILKKIPYAYKFSRCINFRGFRGVFLTHEN